MTSSLCPTCGTPNPPHILFCEKCGARLVASLAEESEAPEAPVQVPYVPKGLSLPVKPAEGISVPQVSAAAEPEEVPDWLDSLRSSSTETSLTASSDQEILAAASAGEVLAGLSSVASADEQSTQAEKPQTDELLPNWALQLRSIPDSAQPVSEEEVPDWLKALGSTGQLSSTESTETEIAVSATDDTPAWLAGLEPASAAATESEEIPDWLQDHSTERSEEPVVATPSPASSLTAAPPEEMPDWLRDLRPTASVDEALPDWLDELGVEETDAIAPSMALSTGDSALDWLSQLGATEPETAPESAVPSAGPPSGLRDSGEGQPSEPPAPDWMSALRAAAPDVDTQPVEEKPDWLREIPEAEVPLESLLAADEAPNWLSEIGITEAPPDVAESIETSAAEEVIPPSPVAEQKPVTDWLRALRGATPEIETGAGAGEEVPEWLRESDAAPGAIGGQQPYEQETPDWLRAEAATSAESAQLEAEQPSAAEEVPDWLKGLGVAAGAAALSDREEEAAEEAIPPSPVAEQKPVTDWLSALRGATPEIETGAGAGEEVPEWLRESDAAPGAIGGPQPYEQETPDWLRESDTISEVGKQPLTPGEQEEKDVPDWLKAIGVTAVGAAAAAPRIEEEPEGEVPDWLSEMSQPAPAPATLSEEPEWLREEQPPAAEEAELPEWLRQAEPVPTVSFEPLSPTVEEEADTDTSEWLREFTPAVPASAAVAEVEEEAEHPGESDQFSKVAPIAAASVAAAAISRGTKKEAPATALAEMPDWLKQLRQEQEDAKGAIQVPAPEAAGLTQSEVPAWVEAMRLKAEAASASALEGLAETEGPLAGIANVLPPAALLGEIQSAPTKLHFDVSAEDQARAGVLRELLSQAALAPARVEQFVVKGTAVRRRAVRWVVAALLITVMLLPGAQWANFNKLLGTQVLPEIKTMEMPPTIKSAVVQLAQLPAGSKALIVFDYDAAQAGELNRVARALVEYLAARGVQMQAASLNPQGPAVAQIVWESIEQKGAGQFTVLPFTPGQTGGVQMLLAQHADVQVIIDLAASPDTVRWWVEQMTANRLAVPLIVGVSTGAEPLTMPYVQSDQVKGMVSGVPGAIAFLQLTGQINTYSDEARTRQQVMLDSLTLANYTLAVLMIVGLIAALFRGAGRRSAS